MSKLNNNLQDKVDLIAHNFEACHKQYYRNKRFGGPSLYFHQRVLETKVWDEKAELLYALLTSWGMHRMGGGPKMKYFTCFKDSLNNYQDGVSRLLQKDIVNLNDDSWGLIEDIFKNMSVMKTSVKIIGSSKVLAHLLPHLIAPIDRQYTLNFLFGSTNFTSNVDYEWRLFKKIHEDFYHKLAENQEFSRNVDRWVNNPQYAWDTSVLKIVDNLVIGAMLSKNQ